LAPNSSLFSPGEDTVDQKPNLSPDQRDLFISLAKKAGITCKQIESVIDISPEYLRKKWKRIPYIRLHGYTRKLKVHHVHKGMIVELLLEAELDIFTISGIFNYLPVTVLHFLETEVKEGNWKVRKCRVCGDPFVAFDERRVCQMITCIEEDRCHRRNSDGI